MDNDTTVGLIRNERVEWVVMEERLTKVKHQNGFPKLGLKMLFDRLKIGPGDIDYVAYPFFDWRTERDLLNGLFWADVKSNLNGSGCAWSARLRHQTEYLRWTRKAISDHHRFHCELEDNLKSLGLLGKLKRVDHQLAHAAGAFYASGFEKALILTLDWYGDGMAGNICLGGPDGIRRIKKIDYPNSLGMFYAQVTHALGFRMCHHEGKIVGLAAFGDPKRLYDQVHGKFRESEGDYRYLCPMDFGFARNLASKYSREDVAAAYQRVLEDVTTRMLGYYVKQYKADTVVFAGGVAANVKLNQRIHEIPGVENIFIFPAMGDDGTGVGAALYLLAEMGGKGGKPKPIDNVFFGPDYTDDEIRPVLDKYGLKYTHYPYVEKEIARLLADKKVVGRFNGRMEYGPRALGNRSILYPATDPAVNDWLNKNLNRSEFMPFAPATLDEHREECYKHIRGAEKTAQFMVITFDCTPWMREHSGAAVHVDGTARPQLVTPTSNPSFYKILTEYRQLTGLPTVINTSFNMHEAPIICTPEDAVVTFLQGHLDILAIGSFIVKPREEGGVRGKSSAEQ